MKSFTTKSSFNESTADEVRYYSNSLYKLYQALKDHSYTSSATRQLLVRSVHCLDELSRSMYDDMRRADTVDTDDTPMFL